VASRSTEAIVVNLWDSLSLSVNAMLDKRVVQKFEANRGQFVTIGVSL
jgi:hypothetical protein